MHWQVLSPDTYADVPWKNGQGRTLELCAQAHAEGRSNLWRVSMATVAMNGAFSDFSGYTRTLLLSAGQGMTLHYHGASDDVLSERFAAAHFDGGCGTSATLHGGAITDLNVMTKTGYCSAKVLTLGAQQAHVIDVDTDWLLLLPFDNAVDVCAESFSKQTLGAMHLLKVTQPARAPWRVQGGPVVCIQIQLD